MQEDRIRCITIIHPADEIKEYRWISAFFRLVGIWVCENVGEEYGDETDYIINIRYNGAYDSDWQRILCGTEGKLRTCSPQPNLKYSENNWLSVVLDCMKDCFHKSTWIELKNVEKYFIQYELMRSSYAIEYFGDTEEPKVFEYMGESRKRFYKAYHALAAVEGDSPSKYMLAAICNCQRRVNELGTIIWRAIRNERIRDDEDRFAETLWEIPFFSYDDINERISRILKKDSKNYAAYAIRGFVKQFDDDKVLESVYDFENAVKLCGRRSYASCLLYHIGKYFETVRSDEEFRDKYYNYAYEVNPYNYRAIYKVAMICKREGNYEKEIELLKEILKLLTPKKDLKTLQPVECAYLYKVNSLLGRRCLSKKQGEEGIFYLERAKQCGHSDKNREFYNWMFGKEYGGVFKDTAVEKLNLYNCYMDLSDAYAMINSYEGLLGIYS